MQIKTLEWQGTALSLLDQTLLPNEKKYVTLHSPEDVWRAINTMQVRGAPAIGVTAAYGMVIAAQQIAEDDFDTFCAVLKARGDYLDSARPTAVNLSWAVRRMLSKAIQGRQLQVSEIVKSLEQEAIAIHLEDEQINKQIGEHALSLFEDGFGVLTHCNAGVLATTKYGTALSPFYLAQERGINIKVYSDETRPRLQGSRLTAFELSEAGIDVTVICDNMAPVLMGQGKINAVIVGCDRVAANGDVANKIGTLGVAIFAKHFGIPMYVAAPTPTIDMACATGDDIPIEERGSEEITCRFGVWTAPKGVKTYNPAFDVTPAALVTAIITERGIVCGPFGDNLKKLFEQTK